MQRQLLQIADKIPDDIVLTLLKSFAKVLSREPEPAPKTPFIRAFAKIRDDGSDRQFMAIQEEEENMLKDYDSGNEVATFDYKVTTNTEEIVYSVGSNNQEEADGQQFAREAPNDEESPEIAENIDEGIEVEMPKLLATEETDAEFETIVEEGEAQVETTEEISNGPTEAVDEVQEISEKIAENDLEECKVEEPEPIPVVEEPQEEEEPFPEEPPKVSLDDIEREIQEMQNFLAHKGVKPEKKKKEKEPAGNAAKNIEDAYQVDVCIKLKNKSHKKHHHSKYLRSENYKEEITKDGPIFDPTIPNTEEDFMKVKSVSERIHRKKQKVQPLDLSWQNLCENQKKLYK